MNFLAFFVSLLLISSAGAQEVVKTARNAEYTKGLFFDQLGNGVTLPPMELEYDLSQEKGSSLSIGNAVFSGRTFFFALLPLGKASSSLPSILSNDEASRYTLIMRWPQALFDEGTLEMISKTGAVLWKMEITKPMQSEWTQKTSNWKHDILEKTGKDVKNSDLFNTQYAEENLEARGAPFWNQKEIFRFCLSKKEGRAGSKLCSIWYGIQTEGKKISLGKVRVDPITPRVLVQSENAPLKDNKAVSADMPTSFFAELLNGESYEFISLPAKLNLVDIADTPKPNILRIVGYDARPTTPSTILNPDQYNSVTKFIGFESTIGDTRKFWSAVFNKDNPQIYMPGDGGGIFKQRFELTVVPRYVARPYMEKDTPNETYYDDFKVFGRKLPEVKLASDQNSVVLTSPDQTEFLWYFRSKERGDINRSYLNVTYKDETYKSYYEVYEGYPREFSLRFTNVVAGGQSNILGELAYTQWFETAFGGTNYWWGRQRWGISLASMQGFGQLKVDQAGDTVKFAVQNLDLKYRFTPGLWARDETVGLILSYQNVTFGEIKAPMDGIGAFWGRSMPRVLDNVLNYIPFFEHPKWVDMELIYYEGSLKSDVKLNTCLALNFHGRVMWTDQIFGEASFGLRRFAFTDYTLRQKANLNAPYGTVGLGVTF